MYIALKSYLEFLVNEHGIVDKNISVEARVLTAFEAIGNTERKDFPLLHGKESLMQATFEGAVGQAFTDMPVQFTGTLGDILRLKLEDNGERALFIAALNAVMRFLGKTKNTIHCKNAEPEKCAVEMVRNVLETYGTDIYVGIVGYQPAIIENFATTISPEKVRVTDLNPENIGQMKFGVEIWDGKLQEKALFECCDIILATGSTIINNTAMRLVKRAEEHKKTLYFYGTSIAGAADALGLNRLCYLSA